jgi:acetyltransferase-like isoleucine patch superfamily enzyme
MFGNLINRLRHLFSGPKIEQNQPPILEMPLTKPICSDSISAPFFHGKSIYIMAGSFVTEDSKIGAYSYIGYNTIITRSTIGSYASIGNRVSIGPGEHELDCVTTSGFLSENSYLTMTRNDTELGPDVWIGDGSVIRRGIKLGLGSVVGALSFVNRDVPPYAVVGGVPARIIKFRFSQKQIDILEASKWWELPLEEARGEIQSIKVFLDS